MNKEELQNVAQKILELKEPLLVEKLAPKAAPYARIIYMVGLVVYALCMLGSFIMLFSNPSAAIVALFFFVVEFVILRLLCEFLLTYDNNK